MTDQKKYITQPTAAPVRKVRMAFYTLLAILVLLGIAAIANRIGIDITHVVVAAITALVPLAVAYMSHEQQNISD